MLSQAKPRVPYIIREILLENPLAGPKDLEGFRMEGDGAASFPLGRLRLEARRDPNEGQAANIVFWSPWQVPDGVAISWNFWPLREPGLSIFFFAAAGRGGEDLFDPRLALRHGPYDQYHHGDIDALHVSYFRRKAASERAFHICNLRKSYGFHLVAQGPDPLPSVADARGPYRIEVAKAGPRVWFRINELPIFEWQDDGITHGHVLGGGRIGFRQMAPLIAEYSALTVARIDPTDQEN